MLRRIILMTFIVIFLFIISGQAIKDSSQLPATLSHRLDSLRKEDNLTDWLYTYREYVSEDPVNRISILTNAQTNAWRECISDSERLEFFNCLSTQAYYLMYGGNILRSIDA